MGQRERVNGLANTHFGTRQIEDKLPSRYINRQGEEVVTVTFNYDDLPAASTDNNNLEIPADAAITKVRLRVIETFLGGTSYAVGLQETDGTEIDNDGLIPAVDAALADLTAGAIIEGSGALVVAEDGTPGAVIGTAGNVVVTEAGTFTAGKAAIEVYYVRNIDRA